MPAQARDLEGHVDSMTKWGVTGWAWMPAAPDKAVQVEAVVDDKVVGRATADQVRQDLADIGKGTGRYGFILRFAASLTGDEAPLLWMRGPSDRSILPSAGWSSVEGYVDNLTRRGSTGWAWIPAAPDKAVQVEAVVDDKVIGRATADQVRQDLADIGKGTGRYGFTLHFGEPLLGDKVPLLRVQGPDGMTILPTAERGSS